ncbi:hypothetical protein Pla123a_21910 [Posidoniimonas polymericola]|uniref:Resolvase HTH domain-containing protein n=1 Tax=Posidoniimonas polymericola TaxID=2528002 RepID=A0A5C5YS19_9BACT|nr:helix-turn-helix domain-containing protein [Posidoniimonas polymericola]TWT77530.1 hypothetical protein Pla123a_21910 [Posidoniimonas polymericola]
MTIGRPKTLDEGKQREVCALTTAGMPLAKIAAYVGCSTKTIRRLRDEDPGFDERMRRAQLGADLTPLEAMRRASGTHWRAAAWMLERQESSSRRRRRERLRAEIHAALDTALGETRELLLREATDPFAAPRIDSRLREIFHKAARSATGEPFVPAGEQNGTKVDRLDAAA